MSSIHVNWVKSKYFTKEQIMDFMIKMKNIKDFLYLLTILGFEKDVVETDSAHKFAHINDHNDTFYNCIMIGDYYISWSKLRIHHDAVHSYNWDSEDAQIYVCKNGGLVGLSGYQFDSRMIEILKRAIGYDPYSRATWKSFEICVEEAASRNYKIKQAREEATRNATPLPPSRRPGGKKFSFDHDYYTIGHESDSIVKSVGMTDIEDAYNESLNVSSWN